MSFVNVDIKEAIRRILPSKEEREEERPTISGRYSLMYSFRNGYFIHPPNNRLMLSNIKVLCKGFERTDRLPDFLILCDISNIDFSSIDTIFHTETTSILGFDYNMDDDIILFEKVRYLNQITINSDPDSLIMKRILFKSRHPINNKDMIREKIQAGMI